ncbi:MAG: nitroreductase family protein [Candidatus Azobacteroides sp.]|nr:nitroreductase family protein [Candidatus Azobacteroides sp.]
MILEQAIKTRKSTRSFSGEIPSTDMIMKIVESGVYAPYGGATGIPLTEIRKIFILRQHTAEMTQATELIHQQIRKNSKRINTLITILPFMKKKMGVFANRLKGFSQSGILSLKNAPYLIIIAEKKGFPPVEKQSMAHALENMWLTATSLGLGFQLISAIGTVSNNDKFLKLLGLNKGEYALEGCLVGYSKNSTTKDKEYHIKDFVTWLDSEIKE